jgi:hypothetical protein
VGRTLLSAAVEVGVDVGVGVEVDLDEVVPING